MSKTPKPPSEDLDKFLLRMPEGLRERIKEAADHNRRSMNAEIIAILEETYPEQSYRYEELGLVYELDDVIGHMQAIRAAALEQVKGWVSEEFAEEAIELLKRPRTASSKKVKLPPR